MLHEEAANATFRVNINLADTRRTAFSGWDIL
jgi:hypothetical protein